jgi:hypothetical protein
LALTSDLEMAIEASQRRQSAWGSALWVAVAPALVSTIVLVASKLAGLSIIENIAARGITGQIVLGIAVIFAALLLGYFVVLREWSISGARTSERLAVAAAQAEADLERVQAMRAYLAGDGRGGAIRDAQTK